MNDATINYIKVLEAKNIRLEKRLKKAIDIYNEKVSKITELEKKIIELESFIIDTI
jgi:hypothetical protein